MERARYAADPEAARARNRAKHARKPEVQRASKARYRAAHPERVAARKRCYDLRRFGITVEQYEEMLAWQNGCCALCGSAEPGGNGKHFHVDHNHETGMIRGLLCSPCNTAIGLLRDDPELCRRAADYLRIELRLLSSAA